MIYIYQSGEEWCFGVYECNRCHKAYTVNDEWGPCTPELCHACVGYLGKQYALVPDPEPIH